MAQKRRYEGLLEEWPERAQLFVKELPGFFAAAPTRDELIEISLPALDLHLGWLEGHGYEGAISDEGGLVIDEDLASEGAIGPLFKADRVAPNNEAVEQALSLGRIALSDAIDLVDALESNRGSSGEIDQIVRHLAVQDLWFATRLNDAPPSLKPIADPVDAMIAAAAIFEERIDDLAGNDPGVVTRDGEEWTLAKLLRRRTSHIREHALALAALESGD